RWRRRTGRCPGTTDSEAAHPKQRAAVSEVPSRPGDSFTAHHDHLPTTSGPVGPIRPAIARHAVARFMRALRRGDTHAPCTATIAEPVTGSHQSPAGQ